MAASDPKQVFCLTLITADRALAAAMDRASVDRIGVDIERYKKTDRQGHIKGARISEHELDDLDALRHSVSRGSLFARLNPINPDTQAEVEKAIANGARVLMLPYFKTAGEVETFARMVDGRARVTVLLETAQAVARLHDILAVGGVDELMVGLNDLHLSFGLQNQFELVASDLFAMIADQVHKRGLPFGFGGLARAGDDRLPISGDLVVAQHARLGSTRAWLARSFLGPDPLAMNASVEIGRLRERIAYWYAQPEAALQKQRDILRDRVRGFTAV